MSEEEPLAAAPASATEAHPGVEPDTPSASIQDSLSAPPRGEEETVDALPVLAEVRALSPASPPILPAVQAAAAAATGFVAGAATLALVRRRSSRRLARAGRSGPRRAVEALPIVGSRTFIVDVHLVAKP